MKEASFLHLTHSKGNPGLLDNEHILGTLADGLPDDSTTSDLTVLFLCHRNHCLFTAHP